MVINMPILSDENLKKLLRNQFPTLKKKYCEQFSSLFGEIRSKCDSSEISTKALDLRGLLSAINLMNNNLSPIKALEMGITNKSFDDYEKQLVADIIATRIPSSIDKSDIFE